MLEPMRILAASPVSVLVAATLAGAAHATPCRLADLGWMAGGWRTATADSRSEERWVAAPGDRLMGSSWALHPAAPGGLVEIESIVADADGQVRLRVRHFGLALERPWETSQQPMTFVAASCGPMTVTFDGEADHAGEHISYRRAGEALTFTGDFLHAGKPVEVVIKFDRAGAD
jgi:hypothetical protein